MEHPTDMIAHTMAFVIPVVEHWLEKEMAHWVHHEGSIQWLSPQLFASIYIWFAGCNNKYVT